MQSNKSHLYSTTMTSSGLYTETNILLFKSISKLYHICFLSNWKPAFMGEKMQTYVKNNYLAPG